MREPTGSPAPNPETPGYLTYAITKNWWPQVAPETVQQWAATHRQYALQLTDAADASESTYRPLFHELLQGSSGQTAQKALNSIANSWRRIATVHQDAATILSHAADYLQGLQHDLTDIIKVNGPAYDSALTEFSPFNLPDVRVANAILHKAGNEAEAAASHAVDRINQALNDDPFANYTPPFPGDLVPTLFPEFPYVLPQRPGTVLSA